MRILLAIIGVIVLLVVGGIVYVGMNLNGLVKAGVETIGPEVLGVSVRLDEADISLLSGEGELRGFAIGNPQGFEPGNAISVARVRVALDMATVSSDPIIVREIIVDGAELATQLTNGGETNLQAILANIETAEEAPAEEAAPGPQVIIERVAVTNTKASVINPLLGTVAVTVPDVNLTEVGRKEGGVTMAELADQLLAPIVAAIVKSMTEGSLSQLLGEKGLRVDGLEEQGRGFMDQLKDMNPFKRDDS